MESRRGDYGGRGEEGRRESKKNTIGKEREGI